MANGISVDLKRTAITTNGIEVYYMHAPESDVNA
jgi:hypothetical protein